MIDLFATHGPDVLAWVLALLGTAGTFLLTVLGIAKWSSIYRGFLQRAWVEVKGAVTEVNQTWVDELRRARLDGTLTDGEKATARSMAIEIARQNIGKKGLARLARIAGVDAEKWIESKVEQAVPTVKAELGRLQLAADATGTTLSPPIAAGPPPVPR